MGPMLCDVSLTYLATRVTILNGLLSWEPLTLDRDTHQIVRMTPHTSRKRSSCFSSDEDFHTPEI